MMPVLMLTEVACNNFVRIIPMTSQLLVCVVSVSTFLVCWALYQYELRVVNAISYRLSDGSAYLF